MPVPPFSSTRKLCNRESPSYTAPASAQRRPVSRWHSGASLGFAVVAALFSPLAQGFSVGTFSYNGYAFTGDANHEKVTIAALGFFKVQVGGREATFSAAARAVIVDANVQTDSEFYDLPEVHFDDETFEAGNFRLRGLRAAIKRKLLAGKYLEGMRLLGQALHSVQDFYAHSTWVEKGMSGLADLGVADSNPMFKTSSGKTCTDGATQTIGTKKTGIILDNVLTGEYFAAEQLTGNVFWDNASDKCIHGSSSFANAANGGAGINKDTEKRDFFPEASQKAAQASQAYISLIVADLGGNEDAILGLLGAGRWKAAPAFPGTLTYSGQLSFSIGNQGYVLLPCEKSSCSRSFWRFDGDGQRWLPLAEPSSNTWQSQTGSGRFREAPVFVIDGFAYLVGNDNSVWQYNASGDSWIRKSDIAGASKRAGFAFAVNGKGYVGGGYANGGALWEYSPANDRWTRKNDHPRLSYVAYNDPTMKAVGGLAFTVDGKAYVTGTNMDTWEYTPGSDAWLNKGYVNAVYGQVFGLGGSGYLYNARGEVYRLNTSNGQWLLISKAAGQPNCYPAGVALGNAFYMGAGRRFSSNSCTLDGDTTWWRFTP